MPGSNDQKSAAHSHPEGSTALNAIFSNACRRNETAGAATLQKEIAAVDIVAISPQFVTITKERKNDQDNGVKCGWLLG